jgi:hypothetical protein
VAASRIVPPYRSKRQAWRGTKPIAASMRSSVSSWMTTGTPSFVTLTSMSLGREFSPMIMPS